MNETNAILAERYRQNDRTAFDALVQRHQDLVFRVCLRMLGHRQDAEDATQETFSRMAKYLDHWDRERPLEPWLVTIAGNRCRTQLARRRHHQSLANVSEPATNGTAQQLAADTLREEVQLALEGLPTKHRLAFELFHQQALPYTEIAEQMGCPVGTVKTWVHRARGKLIEQLSGRDVIAKSNRHEAVDSGEVQA